MRHEVRESLGGHMDEPWFKAQDLTLEHTAGTEGGVWALSEILLEASVHLRQKDREYPVC